MGFEVFVKDKPKKKTIPTLKPEGVKGFAVFADTPPAPAKTTPPKEKAKPTKPVTSPAKLAAAVPERLSNKDIFKLVLERSPHIQLTRKIAPGLVKTDPRVAELYRQYPGLKEGQLPPLQKGQTLPYIGSMAFADLPLILASYLTGGQAGVAAAGLRAAPKAGTLAPKATKGLTWAQQEVARGTGAGVTYGATEAAIKGMEPGEALRHTASMGLLFGAGDVAVAGLGKALRPLLPSRPTGALKGLDLTKPERRPIIPEPPKWERGGGTVETVRPFLPEQRAATREALAGEFGTVERPTQAVVPPVEAKPPVTPKIETVTRTIQSGRGRAPYEAKVTLVNERYTVQSNAATRGDTVDVYGHKKIWIVFDDTTGKIAKGGFDTKREAVEYAKGLPVEKPAVTAVTPETPTITSYVEQMPRAAHEGKPVSTAYIQAKKRPDGKWRLFWAGTRNEIFHGELFSSSTEARNFYKAMWVKAGEKPAKQADLVKELKPEPTPVTKPGYAVDALPFHERVALRTGARPPRQPIVSPRSGGMIEDLPPVMPRFVSQVTPEPQRPPFIPEAPRVARREVAAASHAFSDPKIEAQWQRSNGVQTEPIIPRMKTAIMSTLGKVTREFEHLPHTAENSPLRFELLKLQKQKDIAGDRTLENLQTIIKTIGGDTKRFSRTLTKDYDLFRRKVILDDLANTKGELPFGFTREVLDAEKARIDQAAMSNPRVLAAVTKRTEIWEGLKKEYVDALAKAGFDVSERLNRKDYYRHMVLEYADAKQKRGYLKQRLGSTKDINTNYLEAEYEVMTQMLHDVEVAKSLKKLNELYNIRPKLEAKLAGKPIGDNIPTGYVKWQPRQGGLFYLSESIPFRVAEKLFREAMTQFGIADKEMQRALVKSGHFDYWVVREEVGKTLDDMVKYRETGLISDLSAGIQQKWKVWTLISPRRVLKYNIRNITGDIDGTLAGNPGAFSKVPQAVRELSQLYTGKGKTQNIQDWVERGGMQTLLQVQELGDINRLKMFMQLQEKRGRLGEIPTRIWQGYWKTARLSTDFRESILRYANYLHYLEQMPGGVRPKNFGASIPEEVIALTDVRDRAFKLSNELLGAYDAISVVGKDLRTHLIPFWSWHEVNTKRYVQLGINAAKEHRLAEVAGRKLLGTAFKSPLIAYNVGKFAIKASALWIGIQTYNTLRFPEEVRDLPPDVKEKPYIILGRDKDGNVRYFSRLGALSDFLDWFGMDTAIPDAQDFLNGRRTIKEIGTKMAKNPPNKLINSLSPLYKIPAELLYGESAFPDAFETRQIYDRGEYLAKSFGLEHEYRQIAGKPSKPYKESLSTLYEYEVDPDQSAYYTIQESKRDFLKKIGKGGEGTFTSPRSEALRNVKHAIRYKDDKAFRKYLGEYLLLGGTPEGLEQSIDRMHPLAGLNREEQIAFVQWLPQEDKEQLLKAVAYFETTMAGKPPATN